MTQGKSLSPELYSLYVNDMVVDLISNGGQSYELKSLNLFLLMYADGTVLFSENIDDLQHMMITLLQWNIVYIFLCLELK